MRSRLLAGAIDILAGLAVLVCFVFLDAFTHVAADLRTALVILALLSVCAGLARGSSHPDNTWLKGLFIASAGTPCAARTSMESDLPSNPRVMASGQRSVHGRRGARATFVVTAISS